MLGSFTYSADQVYVLNFQYTAICSSQNVVQQYSHLLVLLPVFINWHVPIMWPGIDHLTSLSDIRDHLKKPSDVRDHLMSLGDLRDHLQLLETISSVTEWR